MEKADARKLSTDAQQQLRYQVIRLRDQVRKFKEISAIIGLSRSTCSTLWNRYLKHGKKALRIKKRGRPHGSCRRINKEQEKAVQRAIRDKWQDHEILQASKNYVCGVVVYLITGLIIIGI